MARLFKRWSNADLLDLIEAYPLALMVSDGPGGFMATPLPMLPDTDEGGRLLRLVGHMALSNPQVGELRAHPRACFLFQGPHGYVSPTLLSDRSWAPTWNYAIARVEADVCFEPEQNDVALRRLVARMEAGRPNAWSVEELGERYGRLAARIIAFHANVRSVDATFKLGQDEKDQMFEQIVSGLDDEPLTRWMHRFRVRRD